MGLRSQIPPAVNVERRKFVCCQDIIIDTATTLAVDTCTYNKRSYPNTHGACKLNLNLPYEVTSRALMLFTKVTESAAA